MAFVRFYYTETAYYDYDNVWDLSIDPITVSGAEMYTQEGRKAQFSVMLDDVWLTGGLGFIYGPAGSPERDIRRVWIEIWDRPAGLDWDIVIFAGFLMRDSIAYDEKVTFYPGTAVQKILKIGTVTVYDWLSVFIHANENVQITLEEGEHAISDTLYDYFSEYAQGHPQFPLNKVAVSYSVETYPDFGTVFTNEQIYQADAIYDYIHGRLLGTDSLPTFQTYLYRYRIQQTTDPVTGNRAWNKYLLSMLTTYKISGLALTILSTDNNSETLMWETNPSLPSGWAYADQLADFGVDPVDWASYHTLTYGSATYDIVDQSGTARMKLLASGTIVRDSVTVTEESTVGLLEWLNYLLNVQYASLLSTRDGIVFSVGNRGFYPTVATWDMTDYKIYRLEIESDISTDTFDSPFEFVDSWEIIESQIREYVRTIMQSRSSRKIIDTNFFLANVGQAVTTPYTGNAQIFIESQTFDFNSKVWTYEGRS